MAILCLPQSPFNPSAICPLGDLVFPGQTVTSLKIISLATGMVHVRCDFNFFPVHLLQGDSKFY